MRAQKTPDTPPRTLAFRGFSLAVLFVLFVLVLIVGVANTRHDESFDLSGTRDASLESGEPTSLPLRVPGLFRGQAPGDPLLRFDVPVEVPPDMRHPAILITARYAVEVLWDGLPAGSRGLLGPAPTRLKSDQTLVAMAPSTHATPGPHTVTIRVEGAFGEGGILGDFRFGEAETLLERVRRTEMAAFGLALASAILAVLQFMVVLRRPDRRDHLVFGLFFFFLALFMFARCDSWYLLFDDLELRLRLRRLGYLFTAGLVPPLVSQFALDRVGKSASRFMHVCLAIGVMALLTPDMRLNALANTLGDVLVIAAILLSVFFFLAPALRRDRAPVAILMAAALLAAVPTVLDIVSTQGLTTTGNFMFPAFFLVVGAVGAGLMVKHTDATSRYQSLVAEAHDGIVLVDEQDRVLESNPTARLLLGLPENPSESLPSLLGEALHPPLDRQLAIIRRDGKERGEYRLELAGRSVFLEILGSRLESDRILLLFRDLTERRALEDRLLRSTRLETAGRVAGGIALELGDLMQVILTHAGAMRARLVSLGQSDSADPEPLDRLDRVTGAAQEAAHLARRLGTLGSEGTPLSKPFSIEDLLVDAASLARPSLPPHTSLTVSMAEPIPPLEGEADALLHALMNLIGNARDAVAPLASPERRGLIRVVARRTTLEGAVPGVLIVVEDNGPGIPPEQRSRIFDAFWSTKSPTKGSGLGLTLVWNLVRELGGDIRVEDATTGGASIRVRLPLKRTLEAPRDASVDDAEPA